jgi:WD40 repeat protein
MPGQPQGRIFISYSRKDGTPLADWLRAWLEERHLSVWQDIVTLEGGRDWWSQIEEALRSKSLQHFILIVTPKALESAIVRREIRLARQEGKTVCPIKGPGFGDLGGLPRWIGQIYDLDFPEHRTTMIRVLEDVSRQKRVPMMAPEPPADFVERSMEFDALKRQLLDPKGDAVAITAGLRGAGGYGKTTLAKVLAHDADIQDAYLDGVLWAELGEKPENLLSVVSDLITRLTGEPPGLETINAAAGALAEALGDRRILLIVDDAWREQDLRPFLQGGCNTTRLVTTRIDSVLPQEAIRQPVDAMREREALQLLAAGLPPEQVAAERQNLGKLAARLGEWAQLLKIVNGFLRDRVKTGEPLPRAIAGVNQRLDAKGLVAFDARNEAERKRAVARSIGVSLDLLDPNERARFGELGVFPEDADIPIGVVVRLWAETGGLAEFETEDLLSRLYDLSLLLNLDLNRRVLRLHDTIRHFLQDQSGKDGLLAEHRRLAIVLDSIRGSPEADALTRRYAYLYLPHHLAAAQERQKLNALLLDPAWLKAKLAATESPAALVADYEQHGVNELQNFIGRTLRLTSGICTRDQRQLIPQLLGRIRNCKSIGAAEFLDAARRQVSPPVMLEQRSSLTPPGAETARLEGHNHWVTALCLLPDGRLASGSWDGTIRLWDTTSGAETARLRVYSLGVTALCALPEGRLASASELGTIQLWDVTSGVEIARQHSSPVTALSLLPDGRLASFSHARAIQLWDPTSGFETARLSLDGRVNSSAVLRDGRLASACDNTIRLWDVTSGVEIARLEGHTDLVTALCVLPDGCLASASRDNTIRQWDVTSGVEIARLQGQIDLVTALCVLPDGRLASGSEDGTIRLWDLTSGVETNRLKEHSLAVTGLCVLPDRRLASASRDKTIRLWDPTSAAESARLELSVGTISALCVLPEGRLASASRDNAIRLWDVTSGVEIARLEGHIDLVTSLCVLPDGRLASGSEDGTIRLWDPTSAVESALFEQSVGTISALCVLPKGRLASASRDKTIRLWDVTSGVETARLELSVGTVTALCVLPDGRLASGSGDGTIRLLDPTSGAGITLRFKGHTNLVTVLCTLPDGRLASASAFHPRLGHISESTIRLWDVTSGAETARLEGHNTALVTALCVLPDGRLASGSDDKTIRLWDIVAGRELTRLEIDAPVRCLAALSNARLVAGDEIGRLHWLECVL